MTISTRFQNTRRLYRNQNLRLTTPEDLSEPHYDHKYRLLLADVISAVFGSHFNRYTTFEFNQYKSQTGINPRPGILTNEPLLRLSLHSQEYGSYNISIANRIPFPGTINDHRNHIHLTDTTNSQRSLGTHIPRSVQWISLSTSTLRKRSGLAANQETLILCRGCTISQFTCAPR